MQEKIAGEKGFELLLCPSGIPANGPQHGQVNHIPHALVMQFGNLFLLGLGVDGETLSGRPVSCKTVRNRQQKAGPDCNPAGMSFFS